MQRIITLALMYALMVFSPLAAPVESGPADLVLNNGRVYTMNTQRDWAQAVAIRDGRVIYVGSDEGAKSYSGGTTRHVDLRGRMVLPSFQDVHIHPVSGGVAYISCPLFDVESLEQLKARVAVCVANSPGDGPVQGRGWSWSIFGEGEAPDKHILDAIDSQRPIVIGDSDGHTQWVNSAALAMAGITAQTKDPAGGEIGRYADSREPDGTLREGAAMELMNARLPVVSAEQKIAGLKYAQAYLNGLGITTIQDAYVRLVGTEPDRSLETYKSLRDSGELNFRVVAALYWEPELGMSQIDALKQARQDYSAGRVQVNAVKLWADGIVETHTALMLEPYSDKPDSRGFLMVPRKDMMAAVPRLDAEGFQVHIHAIGDATVRYALDAFEAARKANGVRDSRHLTAHTQMVNPADIARFGELDVIGGFSPYWAYADSYVLEINPPQLGEKRMQQMYPMRSILDTKGRIAFGSDWYVSTADPLLGIETAVTHIEPEYPPTKVFIPEQRITLDEAIAGYTIGAAYANFLDADTGSLEVGKFADLIVLSENLFEIPADKISDAKVVATVLEGELIYGEL
jgi:predicted amidohydrolase YtcJ